MEPVHILLVEDNEGDILLTKEAFEDAKIQVKLSVVKDGKEAMDFLDKQGSYAETAIPDMLLLDVNLPKKNGHEVLAHIKGNENLKHIPVIMLTTSSSQKDIDLSHDNHADGFITKPIEVHDFLKVVATLESFWITIVKLPATKTFPNDKR